MIRARRYLKIFAIAITGAFVSFAVMANSRSGEVKTWGDQVIAPITYYRTTDIDGLKIFYREAGDVSAPVILLLHGFPTSSHMFRNLIPALSPRYHVIAPDFPGFGHSSAPDHKQFAYTFANYADLVDDLVTKLHLTRYAMYVMDYGAPVGYPRAGAFAAAAGRCASRASVSAQICF